MKKRFFVAALAATMFASAALGLAACSKDPASGGDPGDSDLGGGGGGGGGSKPAGYTITLDANGGSFVGGGSTKTAQTTSAGKILSQPAGPTTAPANKEFYGWGLTSSSSDKITFPYTFDSNTTTIYAIWNDTQGGGGGGGGGGGSIEYTITFDPQGGTFIGESGSTVTRTTVDGKISTGKLPEIEKDGYSYGGWYTEPNGGGSLVNSYTFDASVTVYVKWTKTEVIPGGGGGGGGDINANEVATPSGIGAWLMGEVSDGAINWNKGYVMQEADDGDTKQYALVVYLAKNDKVKIKNLKTNDTGGADEIWCGYSQIPDNEWNGTAPGLAHVTYDDQDNIVVNDAGYYTFYYKYEWGSDKLWLMYSTTKPN